jgi:hypothetical protein
VRYKTLRPHSSLGYRPPAPEAIVPWPPGLAASLLNPASMSEAVGAVTSAWHRRRGQVSTDLVGHIRPAVTESPFHGEGYRKVWARLRHQGIFTAAERVRRLMREHHLQAPRRGGHAHDTEAHDGTITTGEPDVMWGPT